MVAPTPAGADASEIVSQPDAAAPTTEPDDAGADVDAGATPRDASAPSAWIEFQSPAFVSETPMHGGPDWHLSSSRLPAISRSKDAVVVLEALDTSLTGTPSARLSTLATSNAKSRGEIPLLGTEEFHRPKQSANPAIAFVELADVVRARVDAANASLDTAGYTSMSACRIAEAVYDRYPPCSMPSQNIDCDGVRIVYHSQTLTAKVGKRTIVRRFAGWRPQPYKTDNGPIPVKECFGSFFIDASRTVVAGELVYMCQAGGDWCSVDPAWRVVTLF